MTASEAQKIRVMYSQYINNGLTALQAANEMGMPLSVIKHAINHNQKPVVQTVRLNSIPPNHSWQVASFPEVLKTLMGMNIDTPKIINYGVAPAWRKLEVPLYKLEDLGVELHCRATGNYSFLERGIPSKLNKTKFL